MTDTTAIQQGAQLALQKIYVKGCNFDVTDSPNIFKDKWEPKIDMEVNTTSNLLEENNHEVTLKLTIKASQDDKESFKIELIQAGIFQISDATEEQMSYLLRSFCPNTLFPYAREAISTMTTRAGFPPLLLVPINFDSLYAKHLEEIQDKDSGVVEH